jgi:hypothetical protein
MYVNFGLLLTHVAHAVESPRSGAIYCQSTTITKSETARICVTENRCHISLFVRGERKSVAA